MFQDNWLDTTSLIKKNKNTLMIQDLDGVCIPLVNNPLTRKINKSYVYNVKKLKDHFAVLTNGEHEGKRGVNRLVEKALNNKNHVISHQLYLPGLAAGGVEYQESNGITSTPGITKQEIEFLSIVPELMKTRLITRVKKIFPKLEKSEIVNEAETAILDNKYSPTINLNGFFKLCSKNDITIRKELQNILLTVMQEIFNLSITNGLKDSFFLHIAPNLGVENGTEILKYSTLDDIGTTDIQFMLKGAQKEAGLLVLINKFIESQYGKAPFGENFNVRNCSTDHNELIDLCISKIEKDKMPTLIGVGDTVTSVRSHCDSKWLRGGSDRGFLFLIQELGKVFNKPNKIILVDSSGGEVYRPSIKKNGLKGISDPEDSLEFNLIIKNGPKEYLKLFEEIANNF